MLQPKILAYAFNAMTINVYVFNYYFSTTSHCGDETALGAGWSVVGAVQSPAGSRDSSVGIATRYGLDGPGIESR
jgi:hypothetical protein